MEGAHSQLVGDVLDVPIPLKLALIHALSGFVSTDDGPSLWRELTVTDGEPPYANLNSSTTASTNELWSIAELHSRRFCTGDEMDATPFVTMVSWIVDKL